MQKPQFNTILVEIPVEKWGSGNNEGILGKSYREGKIVIVADHFTTTREYPHLTADDVLMITKDLVPGTEIRWNEGVEAGTIWDGERDINGEITKLYAFIYWWDVRSIKLKDNDKKS